MKEISDNHKCKAMCNAHKLAFGGYISGNFKLSITIRLLSGSLCLDLGLLHVYYYNTIYKIMYYALKNYVCNDDVISVNF